MDPGPLGQCLLRHTGCHAESAKATAKGQLYLLGRFAMASRHQPERKPLTTMSLQTIRSVGPASELLRAGRIVQVFLIDLPNRE